MFMFMLSFRSPNAGCDDDGDDGGGGQMINRLQEEPPPSQAPPDHFPLALPPPVPADKLE